MSFEVVATPESSIAVVTDEVLLDFQGKVVVIIHVHLWKDMLSKKTNLVKTDLDIYLKVLF